MSSKMSENLEYFGENGFNRWGRTTELGIYQGKDAHRRYSQVVGALSCILGSHLMERTTMTNGDALVTEGRIYSIGKYSGKVIGRMDTVVDGDTTRIHEIVESKPGWGNSAATIAAEYDGATQPPSVTVYELGETVGDSLREQIMVQVGTLQLGQA